MVHGDLKPLFVPDAADRDVQDPLESPSPKMVLKVTSRLRTLHRRPGALAALDHRFHATVKDGKPAWRTVSYLAQ